MGTFLTLGDREEHDPSPARLREVLDRVEDFEGEEGSGVDLTCADTEWSLGTFPDGRVVWMNLSYATFGSGRPRHMAGVPREKVLALWQLLAAGKIEQIEREPWQPGYGPGG
jgi:hypothetical protein